MSRCWSYPGSELLHQHPFAPFADSNSQGLILGTFPGRDYTNSQQAPNAEDWYYSSAGNWFWELLFCAFSQPYSKQISKLYKQQFLLARRLAISDVVEQCYRIRNSNQDSNLHVQAVRCLNELLAQLPELTRLYLTSKSMYKEFFLPAYFSAGQPRPKQRESIRVAGSCSAEIYDYQHSDGRLIELVLLPSPARMLVNIETMKALYRRVFVG